MADTQTILREERERSLAALERLSLSGQARDDVIALAASIQIAVNHLTQRLGRAIDPRVGPAAMRLMADEIDRVNARLIEDGLAPRLQ